MRKLAMYCQLGLGALFGAALLRSGAADFDAMVRMFLFQDAHLFALAGATTLVAYLGLILLLRSRHGSGVQALSRPIHRGSVLGGVLFGVGWGLSGTCPGTALAQLGSGRVIAVATVLGIVLGNWLFERFASRYFGPATDSCG
jgi:uncharacterized membrane protein YedE/YeeE